METRRYQSKRVSVYKCVALDKRLYQVDYDYQYHYMKIMYIIFVHSLKSEMVADEDVQRVDVNFTGDVMFTRPMIYETPCTVDMLNFPYDEQSCDIVFGSWQYTYEELDMVTVYFS